MEKSQLDIWAIYRDPQEVLTALKIILERKDAIPKDKPLILFTNCVSKFMIDGKEVERHIDTLIYSEEIDIALFLMADRFEDEELGVFSADASDIARFLDKHNIPYTVVFGENNEIKPNDEDIPEIWFARERYVLEDSLRVSFSKGFNDVTYYPDINSDISIGYYRENGSFFEIFKLHHNGLVDTGDNWTLIISEGFDRNIRKEEVVDIIKNLTDENSNKISINYNELSNDYPVLLKRKGFKK